MLLDEYAANETVGYYQEIPFSACSCLCDLRPGYRDALTEDRPAFAIRWHVLRSERVNFKFRVGESSEVTEVTLSECRFRFHSNTGPCTDAVCCFSCSGEVTGENTGDTCSSHTFRESLCLCPACC